MVPCDPIEIFTTEYGNKSNWMMQSSKKFYHKNVNFNEFDTWNDTDYVHAIKFFSKNGQLNVTRTLNQINSYIKKKIYKLPYDTYDPLE
jgi:hypothetical protein